MWLFVEVHLCAECSHDRASRSPEPMIGHTIRNYELASEVNGVTPVRI